ncbi:MAG TPA: SDH family Clp fold serine proteinase [Candidatus Hypogeohydataceae bacterium YC40]
MENLHGLKGPNLDFIIHSPGGSAETVEAIISYLRSKFSHIRVIVPQQAMSAATMLACGANVIVMGKHSFLGPIDPQIILPTPSGRIVVAAWAVLEQFDRASEECQDPKKMAAWLPLLAQYPPGLLVQCQEAKKLSEDLVKEWLAKFMFTEEKDANDKATRVAGKLSDHSLFKSHGRHISRDKAEEMGLKIQKLEDNPYEQDAFLSIFHATTHTFNGTPAVKIMENHMGKAFINAQVQVPFVVPGQPPVVLPSPPQTPKG